MFKNIVNYLLGSKNRATDEVFSSGSCPGCKKKHPVFLNGICKNCYKNGLCPACHNNNCSHKDIICKECSNKNICPTCFSQADWVRPSHICSECSDKCTCEWGGEMKGGACPKCLNRFTPNDQSTRMYECNICVMHNRASHELQYCYVCNYDYSKTQSYYLGELCLCRTCWFYDESKATLASEVPPPEDILWNNFDKRRRKIRDE